MKRAYYKRKAGINKSQCDDRTGRPKRGEEKSWGSNWWDTYELGSDGSHRESPAVWQRGKQLGSRSPTRKKEAEV